MTLKIGIQYHLNSDQIASQGIMPNGASLSYPGSRFSLRLCRNTGTERTWEVIRTTDPAEIIIPKVCGITKAHFTFSWAELKALGVFRKDQIIRTLRKGFENCRFQVIPYFDPTGAFKATSYTLIVLNTSKDLME